MTLPQSLAVGATCLLTTFTFDAGEYGYEMKKAPAIAGALVCQNAQDHAFGRMTISTRRFWALPAELRLLATGWLSPRPIA